MKKEIVKPGSGWEEPETGDKVRGACAAAWGVGRTTWGRSSALMCSVREGVSRKKHRCNASVWEMAPLPLLLQPPHCT